MALDTSCFQEMKCFHQLSLVLVRTVVEKHLYAIAHLLDMPGSCRIILVELLIVHVVISWRKHAQREIQLLFQVKQ